MNRLFALVPCLLIFASTTGLLAAPLPQKSKTAPLDDLSTIGHRGVGEGTNLLTLEQEARQDTGVRGRAPLRVQC